MEIFLAILMVLGIFIVVPAIIGFIIIAIASGLFRVIFDRMQKRAAPLWDEVVRVSRALVPQRRSAPAADEPVTGKAI